MANLYLKQSGLAHLHLGARALADRNRTDPGVLMRELPTLEMINLRGDPQNSYFTAALKSVNGIILPIIPNTFNCVKDHTKILWLGPNEWLIINSLSTKPLFKRLCTSMKKLHSAVTEVGDGKTTIRLSGPNARQVLSKGCSLDLHSEEFLPGHCAQTILGRSDIVVSRMPDAANINIFDITVARSYAAYTWAWLEDAAQEFESQVIFF
tara:strand:- start:5636 stop:6262 length:627 start_codon:yes stop_codon:yes gene_type:complete